MVKDKVCCLRHEKVIAEAVEILCINKLATLRLLKHTELNKYFLVRSWMVMVMRNSQLKP